MLFSTPRPERAGQRRPLTTVVCLIVAIAVLAGCQLNVDVGVTVNADGTGEVAVTAVVDADVVAQAPGLAGALQLADATTAGWAVDPPTATEDGGLSVSLRHPFTSVEEATSLLNSLGPPFSGLSIGHVITDDDVTVTVAGSLSLPGGTFDAFADAELVGAVGGVPFAAQLAAAGATPASSMTVELSLRLPGDVAETTGDERDGAIVWEAPLDGSAVDLTTRSVLSAGGGGGGGSLVSTIALVAGIAWLVAGGVLIWRVVQARNRRRSRALRRFY
ncbi:LppM family (lipo)protein [Desertimonas flava]|uniref:LppM family (lipo)protein n=1 Tax=Desertimonas flava TaxID=2064846 RepID=UPI000E347077|nr:hypothetical protein [Desertimonas flava]